MLHLRSMPDIEYQYFYRRNLPHYQPLGGTFFITTCLTGSIPRSTIDWYLKEKHRFEQQADNLPTSERAKREREIRRRWFSRIESALHKSTSGPIWLKDERVAKIVMDALHFFDGKRYRIDAFTVMPNHLHLVIAPLQMIATDNNALTRTEILRNQERYYSLPHIMHSIKSFTSLEGNKLLDRSGEFWQSESYDHAIRNQQEWERVIAYVINNPVKAGLVRHWQEWPYTYVRTM
ncbi:MAG TPA: hypothetical protein VFC63_19925 [Blastocatellia bacterium]|nr:hypothetical protein [Blastocatellia bacterium]